jgi:sugar/nucleoside kinase (ribokinase family)
MKRGGSGGVDLVVVGSVGLDTVETTSAKWSERLGGSVSYACAAARLFARTGMVGVVGTDFPARYRNLYRRLGIDTAGLQVAEGRTFRWSGVYEPDMINRRTLSTELNVFADFMPELPESYAKAPYVLLGNIAPALQLHVLRQVRRPEFVSADTMDLWIRTAMPDLARVIAQVDMLAVNDSEARLLTGEHNLKDAGRKILKMGPRYVVVKKGEHGALLMAADGDMALFPAYPVDKVRDPTGAGDAFAGACMGVIATAGTGTMKVVCEALLTGAVVASHAVEAVSLDGLKDLTAAEVARRRRELLAMMPR